MKVILTDAEREAIKDLVPGGGDWYTIGPPEIEVPDSALRYVFDASAEPLTVREFPKPGEPTA